MSSGSEASTRIISALPLVDNDGGKVGDFIKAREDLKREEATSEEVLEAIRGLLEQRNQAKNPAAKQRIENLLRLSMVGGDPDGDIDSYVPPELAVARENYQTAEASVNGLLQSARENQREILGPKLLPLSTMQQQFDQLLASTNIGLSEEAKEALRQSLANTLTGTHTETVAAELNPETPLETVQRLLGGEAPMPEEILEIVKERMRQEGWVSGPEYNAVIDSAAAVAAALTTKETALFHALQKERELGDDILILKDRLTRLQSELATANMSAANKELDLSMEREARAELQTELARLREQLESLRQGMGSVADGSVPAVEEKKKDAPSVETTASQRKGDREFRAFEAYVDNLFRQRNKEFLQYIDISRARAQGFSEHARVDTLTNFGDNVSNYSGRYGLLTFINYLSGDMLGIFPNGLQIADQVFNLQKTQEVKAIAEAVEILSSSQEKMTKMFELYVKKLACGRKYRGYSYHESSKKASITELAFLQPDDLEKTSGLFIDLEGLPASLRELITLLRELTNGTHNLALEEIIKQLSEVAQSRLFSSLEQFSSPTISVSSDDWITQNRYDGKESVGAKVIEIFQKNPNDAIKLREALVKLGVLLSNAFVRKSLPDSAKPSNFVWDSETGKLGIKNARNPYSVLLSAYLGGQRLSDLPYASFRLDTLRGSQQNWPGSSFEYRPIRMSLDGAVDSEVPINFEFSTAQPVALLVGNNGAGKTHAMETLAQALGLQLTMGGNMFAEQTNSPPIAEVRTLIGGSKHDTRLSSFQRESLLLKDILESLTKKNTSELGLFAIDEVGKGTDSRDAIALMVAVMEYCRRRDVHLMMATHHGKEFVEVLKQLGLRDLIKIYAPDFETHQLQEHDSVVDSHGIEVMEKRALGNNIDARLIGQLISNARLVRKNVVEGGTSKLEAVQTDGLSSGVKFAFMEPSSLGDLGMTADTSGYEPVIGVSLRPLHEPLWRGKYSAYGRASYHWRLAEKRWGELFQAGFTTSEMSRQELASRHELIKSLVEQLKKTEAEMTAKWATDIAVLTEGLFRFNPAETNDELEANLKKVLESDNPLERYLDDRDGTIPRSDSLTTNFVNPAVRQALFRSLENMAGLLAQSSDPGLQAIGKNLKLLQVREAEFVSVMKKVDEDKPELLTKAIGKSIAKKIEEKKYLFEDKHIESLAVALGVSKKEKIAFLRENLIEPLIRGEMRVWMILKTWVQDNQKSSGFFGYGLTEVVNVINEVNTVVKEIGEKIKNVPGVRDQLQSRRTRTETPLNRTNEMPAILEEAAKQGDWETIVLAMDIAAENEVEPRDQYSTLSKYFRFNRRLNYRRVGAWQEAQAAQAVGSSEFSLVKDFATLGLSVNATPEEVTTAYRNISRANHPDFTSSLSKEEQKRREAIFQAATEARDRINNIPDRAKLAQVLAEQSLSDLAFLYTVAHNVKDLHMVQPTYTSDGSFKVEGSISLGLLEHLPKELIVRQSLEFDGTTDVVVIGGTNGGGKTQLLSQMAQQLAWAEATGFVPAIRAELPKHNFVFTAINAGESTEHKSSFQNEIDRYNDLLKRYVAAGCPTGGIIFLDEPLAGTSSEDQISILLALIDFFKQRDVKVVLTNHNYRFYDAMRATTCSDGSTVDFLPVAYLDSEDPTEKYTLRYYNPQHTDEIRSDGIKVAGEMGVPQEIIQLAYYIRNLMTENTKKAAETQ